MYRIGILVACALALPGSVYAAGISLDPERGVYGRGDTFMVNVRLHTNEECVNATQVVLEYPVTELRAVDFSRGGSIISLWVEEPKLDIKNGKVTFSGGIPGGYCGRIQGDPSQSNVLGKVVFTALNAGSAKVTVSPESLVYLNDGRGTEAELTLSNAEYSIAPVATQSENPWLAEVGNDTTPPDPFSVNAESTSGVFGGKYYLVFATLDKQSGLDHYEVFEEGAWKTVTSPYVVPDQFLQSEIKIKAIDKAGNERIGEYVVGSESSRAVDFNNLYLAIGVIILLILVGFARLLWDKRKKADETESGL
jgi:hypothetical protein